MGMKTIGSVSATEMRALQAQFGPRHGRILAEHSYGIDRSQLAPVRMPKSFSSEHTFQADVLEPAQLWHTIQRQSAGLSDRLHRRHLLTSEVAVKLRYADWEDLVRQTRLQTPTADPALIAQEAASLMRRVWDRTRPVRLLGVRVSRFVEPDAPVQLGIPWERDSAFSSR
jgi:DNA polymerase-4